MFKLLELELSGHNVLGKIKISFTDEGEIKEGPYSTVIIGPNGTGKSNLLRTITDIFREIENIVDGRKEQKLAGCTYKVKYFINGNIFEYTNSKRHLIVNLEKPFADCLKNNDPIEASEMELPNSIIASSIMLNDRFYIPKDYEGHIYQYLGARRINTPSVGGTQTYTRRLVELLLDKATDSKFLIYLQQVLSLMEYENELQFNFYPRYRNKIFTGELTNQKLYNFYVNWEETLGNRKHPPYGHSYFINHLKNNNDLIQRIVNVINKITNNYSLNKRGNRFTFSIYDANLLGTYREELQILGSLDLLSDFNFKFLKKSENSSKQNSISSEEISSGEYHIFSSLIGILTLIQDNSLILLDEPDISLHPNWQMKYIHYLKKVFENFPSSQFILATHSHFLVSDMEPKTSSLIGLRKNENNVVEIVDLPKSTYGWSAEEVLYNVFGLRTVRNYYFEMNLSEMLSLISEKSENRKRIAALYHKLAQYVFDKDDPLNLVLEQTLEYLENVN